MKKFEVSTEYKAPIFKDTSLEYDHYYGMYFLRSSDKITGYVVANAEEFFKFQAGEVTHLFPQYDSNKHYVENQYNSSFGNFEKNPLMLKEFEKYDISKFPYGIFSFQSTNNGIGLKQISFAESDKYIEIGRELQLYENFLAFKKLEKNYEKLGQRQRQAILLYGPPGNGKTIEITRLAKVAQEEKFRVFFINDSSIRLSSLNSFRPLFDSEYSIFVIEEITERTCSNVEELLSFLDGETSWNKSYTIATTNHPEEIPWNIIDRPSRFKTVKEVKNPNSDQRRKYFKAMGVAENDIIKAIEVTENLSLDYVKHIIADSLITDRPIPEIVLEYKSTKSLISKQFKNSKLGL